MVRTGKDPKRSETVMGENLSELSKIRTDRIARTAPKGNRRRKGHDGKFESHLKKNAGNKPPPANEDTSERAPDSPSAAPPPRGRLMDFTA